MSATPPTPDRAKHHHRRLDPHAPLVIDTRELGRRPGSMRRLEITVPAPDDLAIEVIGVPKGADLRLDLRLESVMEGVLVSGIRRRTAGGRVRPLPRAGRGRARGRDRRALRVRGQHHQRDRRRRGRGVVHGRRPARPRAGPARRDRGRAAAHPAVRGRTAPACASTAASGSRSARRPHDHPVLDPRWAALEAYANAPDEAAERLAGSHSAAHTRRMVHRGARVVRAAAPQDRAKRPDQRVRT